jgi:hypothetical protein
MSCVCSEHRPYVSRALRDFIAKLLVEDPAQRMTASMALAHEFIRQPGKEPLDDKVCSSPAARARTHACKRLARPRP